MADWVTLSSLATAGGTLVLAVATFSSVKSGNRSARIAERSLRAGLRPVLIPSREEDPVERIRFGDGQVITVPGHGATVEVRNGVIFMALALRNGGSGLAVIDAWRVSVREDRNAVVQERPAADAPDLDEFHQQQLDLYIPAGDTGYWQGALRDPQLPGYDEVRAAVSAKRPIQIDLLYGDYEGEQRTIGRFVVSGWPEDDDGRAVPGAKRASVIKYWNVSGDPRL
jgi:hypothetical protein